MSLLRSAWVLYVLLFISLIIAAQAYEHVAGADSHSSRTRELLTPHAAKDEVNPMGVPAKYHAKPPTKLLGFNWSSLLIKSLGGVGKSFLGELGFAVLQQVTDNFFGLMKDKDMEKVKEELKAIQELVSDISNSLTSIQNQVSSIQVGVQTAPVKQYMATLQGIFDTFTAILERAPTQDRAVTEAALAKLIEHIEDSVYESAMGIYLAMTGMTSIEQPLLEMGYEWVKDNYFTDTQDAVDVYGIAKSFSATYMIPMGHAATLLHFAANYTGDLSLEILHNNVMGWVNHWSDLYEMGDNPIIPHDFSDFSREILRGTPDNGLIGLNSVLYLYPENKRYGGLIVTCHGDEAYFEVNPRNNQPLATPLALVRSPGTGKWTININSTTDEQGVCAVGTSVDSKTIAGTNECNMGAPGFPYPYSCREQVHLSMVLKKNDAAKSGGQTIGFTGYWFRGNGFSSPMYLTMHEGETGIKAQLDMQSIRPKFDYMFYTFVLSPLRRPNLRY